MPRRRRGKGRGSSGRRPAQPAPQAAASENGQPLFGGGSSSPPSSSRPPSAAAAAGGKMKIWVQLPDGDRKEVVVSGSDMVGDLKQKVRAIWRGQGLAPDLLYFRGSALLGDRTDRLSDYGIREGATVLAERSWQPSMSPSSFPPVPPRHSDGADREAQLMESIQKKIERGRKGSEGTASDDKFTVSLTFNGGEHMELSLSPRSTVGDLKRDALTELGGPDFSAEFDLSMSYEGTDLAEDATLLTEYGIGAGSTVDAVVIDAEPANASAGRKEGEEGEAESTEDGMFNVLVQFPDGECGEVETAGYLSVRSVRDAAERSYGRAAVTKKLTFEGTELVDDEGLSVYNIREGSIIVAQMQVYVYFLKKKGFLLDVNPEDTIAEVKAMIESREPDFPMADQRIFLEGTSLDNEMSLKRSGVVDNANLFVVVRDKGTPTPEEGCMQLYVKSEERILPLAIAPTDTIGDLKRMLARREGIDPDHQRLSFAGENVDDDAKMLYECGIIGECLVHLVRRPGTGDGGSRTEGGGPRRQFHEHLAEIMEQQRGSQQTDQSREEDSITVHLMDQTNLQRMPFAMKKDTTLGQVFNDYSNQVCVPKDELEFLHTDLGELPSDCAITAAALGIKDGETILVRHQEAPSSSSYPLNALGGNGYVGEGDTTVMDLTGFSAGSGADADEITVVVKGGGGRKTPVLIDRNATTLQLVFSTFADQWDIDPASLLYVCDARRLSHESEETAAQYGIVDRDVIHAIANREGFGQENYTPPRDGKISMNVLEIGKPQSENEFFRVNVDARLEKVLKQFAARKRVELDTLRFSYQGRILYADAYDDATPRKLGIREGDTVHALVKKPKRPATLTPNATHNMHYVLPGQVFEPVVQILNIDVRGKKVDISDGYRRVWASYHPRMEELVQSGVLKKFAVIWVNDFDTANDNHFTLLDASEAAPNPGAALSSQTRLDFDTPRSTRQFVSPQKKRRLDLGLPFLSICTSCRSIHDELRHCSRCKFVGYCTKECQTKSWKNEGHKSVCRYAEAYYNFVREEFDEDEWEIADIFTFWTDLRERFGPSKPFDHDVAASIYNISLHSAHALLEKDFHLPMAKAYILNAAFLRQCCETPIDDMVEWYDIGSEGIALNRFLLRVPHFKAGYEVLLSEDEDQMMTYLEDRHAFDQNIVGSTLLEDEVLLRIRPSTGDLDDHDVRCKVSKSIRWDLLAYAQKNETPLERLWFTFVHHDGSTLSLRTQKPYDLGMEERCEYVVKVSAWNAQQQRAQKIIGRFIMRQRRLRKVREILARNIIADVVWRHRENKARRTIADFIWHHHRRRKSRTVIRNLIWQRIASRRRQKLRSSATAIQRLHRGHSARKIHLGPLKRRLEEFRKFNAAWKQAIEKVPETTQPSTGWGLVRENIDVKRVELMDDDGNLADTDEKLNQALTDALNEESNESDDEEEDTDADFDEVATDHHNVDATNNLSNIDWSQFQVTSHVVKFMKSGDAKYRDIFVKKMRQLAKGERSHKLQKPLKGCESIIYESYLENKSGFRILWTQEGDQIVVWFVAKHKSVSRLMKLIDDAKSRTARQQLPENFVSELSLENGNSSHPAPAKRGILLDALGNVPLKLYDVNFDSIDDIVDNSWTPQMHLTEEERKVVEAKGTVLLLGRSGTGKTVCICNRIEYDRQRLGHKPNFKQLFVSRSSQLCRYVEGAVGGTKGSSFTTFDKLVRHLESLMGDEINRSFHPRHLVNFSRFKREFYTERFPQEEISALIVWKAIRTFLKGSIEAFQTPTGHLSREYFVSGKLGKNRCKVPSDLREQIYGVFLQYQLWLDELHLWDDCDHILALLKGIENAKKSHALVLEEEIKQNKLYVDEVQDYTQLEILLFFYIGGGPGALFLAGDPAQSVVEGTDFRFEEVRSVGYFVAGKERRHLIPEKPKVVNVNFRSHAGVLNCAGGFLDLLFDYFPGSAKQLPKDHGLFKGARPGVFHSVQVQQLSTLLKERMQGAVVLTHDDSARQWREKLGHPLVYGIREAKGLEFKTVIILDFFSELPPSLQKPWRNLLLQRADEDFEYAHPLVETHLKLIYTAVTRCIEQLFFAETSSSTAGDAAVRWLTTTSAKSEQDSSDVLATRNSVEDLESMTMTSDEFVIVGIDNAELAGSADVEFDQALSYLDRALYCFQKAQHSELVAKAQAHCASIQLRKQLARPARSDGDRQMTEEETVQALELLLSENLLEEGMNLLDSIAPTLSPYIQQKLEENLLTKIRHALGQ